MSTEATGHGTTAGRPARSTPPRAPTAGAPTFCGRSAGLFWFGHVDFHQAVGDRCPTCVDAAAARGGRAESTPGPLTGA